MRRACSRQCRQDLAASSLFKNIEDEIAKIEEVDTKKVVFVSKVEV